MLTINAFIFDNVFAFNNADDAFAFDKLCIVFDNAINAFTFDNVFAFNNADDALYSIMLMIHSHLTMYCI